MLLLRKILMSVAPLSELRLLSSGGDFAASVKSKNDSRSDNDSEFSELTVDVAETRSPPPPKSLSSLRINEGGNINRADILGTVSELKLLDRLSQPEKQWATLFVRTRVPILSDYETVTNPTVSEDEEGSNVKYHLRTYHNRVHVFDRRLLPLVRRLKPGDRIFVTGFLSYYKPTSTASPAEVAKVRKIGAVVAERLVLLGSEPQEKADDDNQVE